MRALLVVLLAASTARAESPPQLVVSLPLFALSSRAIAVEGELPVAERVSVSVATGVRDPGGGQFGGYALAVSPALRGWWRPAQRGVHAVIRVESSLIHLERDDMNLGTAVGVDAMVGIGYRFVIRGRVVITPDLGFGVDYDFAHGLVPAQRRWSPFYGLSVGGSW